MSQVASTDELVTKTDLANFYQGILPYLGGMPEIVANKFTKSDLYSTDEKIIGQWTDGKPLYQKTFAVAVTTQSAKTVKTYNLISDNTIKMRNAFGSFERADGNIHTILHVNANQNDGSVAFSVMITQDSSTGVSLIVKSLGTLSTTATAYCTIQYTKTTDSAISIGNDTDYSTDEKIIGTWVDGKPLYQKTYNFTTPTGASGIIVPADSSIADIINMTGGIISNDKRFVPINWAYDTSRIVSTWRDGASGAIYMKCSGSGERGLNAYITIQYTKSTD